MNKFYVSGVIDSRGNCERVGDAEAQFWTVYERFANGTSQAICDCDSKESAGLAAERMNNLQDAITTLINAIGFAVDPMLWCQRESDIFQYRGKVWFAEILKSTVEGVQREQR